MGEGPAGRCADRVTDWPRSDEGKCIRQFATVHCGQVAGGESPAMAVMGWIAPGVVTMLTRRVPGGGWRSWAAVGRILPASRHLGQRGGRR